MVGRSSLLALAVLAAGCGSNESALPETKPADVAVQLTPEQQAWADGPGKDPNYDPAEAAAQGARKKK